MLAACIWLHPNATCKLYVFTTNNILPDMLILEAWHGWHKAVTDWRRKTTQALVGKIPLPDVPKGREKEKETKLRLWLTAKNNTVEELLACLSQVNTARQKPHARLRVLASQAMLPACTLVVILAGKCSPMLFKPYCVLRLKC